jgi:hypothetical protein
MKTIDVTGSKPPRTILFSEENISVWLRVVPCPIETPDELRIELWTDCGGSSVCYLLSAIPANSHVLLQDMAEQTELSWIFRDLSPLAPQYDKWLRRVKKSIPRAQLDGISRRKNGLCPISRRF